MVNLKESGCESQELTSSLSQIWLVLLEGWSWIQIKYCLFWVLHPSDATGREVHSNFPHPATAIQGSIKISLGIIIQVIPPTCPHIKDRHRPQSTEKENIYNSHNLNFHQKMILQMQLVELPKTLRSFLTKVLLVLFFLL